MPQLEVPQRSRVPRLREPRTGAQWAVRTKPHDVPSARQPLGLELGYVATGGHVAVCLAGRCAADHIVAMAPLLPLRSGSQHLNAVRASRGFHWWYPAIIDRMLAHPEWTKQQVADDLGLSYSTIYLVTSCDLFRAHYERRRGEISQAHDESIKQRLVRAATVSLDRLIETVEQKPVGSISIPHLLDMSVKVLDKLGYGPQAAPQSPVQVNLQNTVVQATTQDLIEARAALRRSEETRILDSHEVAARPAIDYQVEEGSIASPPLAAEVERAAVGHGEPAPALEDL